MRLAVSLRQRLPGGQGAPSRRWILSYALLFRKQASKRERERDNRLLSSRDRLLDRSPLYPHPRTHTFALRSVKGLLPLSLRSTSQADLSSRALTAVHLPRLPQPRAQARTGRPWLRAAVVEVMCSEGVQVISSACGRLRENTMHTGMRGQEGEVEVEDGSRESTSLACFPPSFNLLSLSLSYSADVTHFSPDVTAGLQE